MVNRSDPKEPSEAPLKSAGEGSQPSEALASQDVALVSGRSRDGEGLTIVRSRKGRLEAGVVKPLAAGKAIHGEVVRLTPRKAFPMLCDVETVLESRAPDEAETGSSREGRHGPPQVASEAYRKNWDAIYQRGKKQQLLN